MSALSNRFAACAAAALLVLSLAGCGSADSSAEVPAHPAFVHSKAEADTASVTTTSPDTAPSADPSSADEQTTTVPAETTAAETTTTAPETTAESSTAETTTASSDSDEEEESEDEAEEQSDLKYEIDSYGQKIYKFSDKYEKFLDRLTFVGDSICYGLEVYDYLAPDNVLASGSVAARNIFDFTFDVGDAEYGIIDAVKKVSPDILIFSMGMNDINLTTPEQYCENYMDLLDKVHAAVPSAKLYVASITPISGDSDFNNNTNIDEFNSEIKKFLADSGKGYGYVDIASYLKNKWNGLALEYSGGDGIHLQSSAYSAILYQVCEQLCN